MIETVRSYGYIAVLINPLGADAFEETNERLYDGEAGLDVNYDCTLLYSDKNKDAENLYGLSLGADSDAGTPEQFVAAAKEAGVEVDPATVRPYSCVWHNRADSDMSTLTKEEFLLRTGQA